MRSVDSHLMCQEKVNETVSHFMNTNQPTEVVSTDQNALSLISEDDGTSRIVTVMHPVNFASQISRQLVINGETTLTEWGEELLGGAPNGTSPELMEEEGRLAAALVAHLSNQLKNTSHTQLMQDINNLTKANNQRVEAEQLALVDGQLRLFSTQQLTEQPDLSVEINTLPTLPPLTHMKRVEYLQKNKEQMKQKDATVPVNVTVGNKVTANRKSLPHKKRISKRLKKPPNATQTQQICQEVDPSNQLATQPVSAQEHATANHDILFVNCIRDEQILPDAFTTIRPILICQLCNEFFGEEQLKFYQHLKHHYEPNNATIIIENPVSHHLPLEKITGNCLAETEEALAELGLDKPEFYRQPIYSAAESLYLSPKVTFTTSSTDCQNVADNQKTDCNANKEIMNCDKCGNAFKNKRQLDNHQCEDLNEFSEPEDLMVGINVIVEADDLQERHQQERETTDVTQYLPQMTVDTNKQWYVRPGCSECSAGRPYHHTDCSLQFKEEVLRRILESSGEVENVTPATNAQAQDNLCEIELSTEKFFPKSEVVPVEATGCNEAPMLCVRDEATQTRTEAPSTCDGVPAHPELPPPPPNAVDKKSKKAKIIKFDAKKPKVFPCPNCGKIFKRKNSLVYHILSHSNTRPHKCQDCDKAFYTSGQLKVHTRVHSGDRPYSCQQCPKSFRQWGDLKYHIASLHESKKKYKCEHCGKQFARKYSLNLHVRIHTGEKNYQCDYCEKTFSASSYRLVHMRIHTGVRPYQCGECQKAFRSGGDLRRHQLVHMKFKRVAPKLEQNIGDDA